VVIPVLLAAVLLKRRDVLPQSCFRHAPAPGAWFRAHYKYA